MSAEIIQFREAKARAIALRKAAAVSALAGELRHYQAGKARRDVARLYIAMGWANAADVRRALEALEKERT
jgi:hypothetical protein